ncbi:MAG: energy-coupling factor transporter transmembrane protein EcfT [Marinifilaceae bacterium]|jgi:cobalt/nickel transport system permease protein|nr:energy-coupling factor transporter transmembrane protein EcfT [Marinifilaceae bacterium]
MNNFLDSVSSKLDDIDLYTKLSFVLPMLIFSYLADSLCYHIGNIILFVCLAYYFVNLSLWALIRIWFIPVLFIFFSSLGLAINIDKQDAVEAVWILDLFNLANINQASFVFFRSISIFSVIIFSILILSISEISEILRKMKLPGIFIDLVILTYKFVHIISHNTKQKLISQRLRLAYKNNRAKNFSLLLSAVFTQSVLRTKAVNTSVLLRNGDEMRFMLAKKTFKLNQHIIFDSIILLMLIFLLITKQYG